MTHPMQCHCKPCCNCDAVAAEMCQAVCGGVPLLNLCTAVPTAAPQAFNTCDPEAAARNDKQHGCQHRSPPTQHIRNFNCQLPVPLFCDISAATVARSPERQNLQPVHAAQLLWQQALRGGEGGGLPAAIAQTSAAAASPYLPMRQHFHCSSQSRTMFHRRTGTVESRSQTDPQPTCLPARTDSTGLHLVHLLLRLNSSVARPSFSPCPPQAGWQSLSRKPCRRACGQGWSMACYSWKHTRTVTSLSDRAPLE